MSSFADRFESAAVPALFSRFGDAASYYSPGATSVTTSCTVIVEPEAGIIDRGLTGVYEQRPAMLRVRESDITTPQVRGHFVVGDEQWAITSPPILAAGVWECRCLSSARAQAGSQRR